MTSTPRIAVLIPCHNEEATIAQVVADFRQALPEATIYVYDNCSTDATAAVARAAGATVRSSTATTPTRPATPPRSAPRCWRRNPATW